MKILETIFHKKLQEIEIKKSILSINELQKSNYFNSACYSLKNKLNKEHGVIAEFKRQSPSKGIINANAEVEKITKGYEENGAIAISVLTDEYFFGAHKTDFQLARKNTKIPILRKDFIIDEYQVYETKAIGADVVLLIARILTVEKAKELCLLSKKLGMEVLLEIHSEEELESFIEILPDIIGVNNRNLNSFEVDVKKSIQLANQIPNDIIKIAESGIESTQTLKTFIENGFKGFLIGEYLMKQPQPYLKCGELTEFIKQVLINNFIKQ